MSNGSYEGNINYFQQKGHIGAEREHFLPHAGGFQNLVRRSSKDTLGAGKAEVSAGA